MSRIMVSLPEVPGMRTVGVTRSSRVSKESRARAGLARRPRLGCLDKVLKKESKAMMFSWLKLADGPAANKLAAWLRAVRELPPAAPGLRPPSRSLRGYRASEARPDKTFRGIRDVTISWTARVTPGTTEVVYPSHPEKRLTCPRRTPSAS